MAHNIQFSVSQGSLASDCLPETRQFIEENLAFFHGEISHLNDVLNDPSGITFVSAEQRWSFACKIEKAELGKIAEAQGMINEGGQSQFDELLAQLSGH